MSATEELTGRRIDEVELPLERSKIREFARALGDDSPIYADPGAARDAGHAGVPAPLTATAMAMHWRARSEEELVAELGLDLARILHGESEWEYLAPVLAGDRLTGERRIAGVRSVPGKRGGEMKLIVFETEYRNQDGELVIRQRDTLIETAPR